MAKCSSFMNYGCQVLIRAPEHDKRKHTHFKKRNRKDKKGGKIYNRKLNSWKKEGKLGTMDYKNH